MLPTRLFILFLLLALSRAWGEEPSVHLTVQFEWHHQFQYAGFYAALTQGYYREAGLDVQLRELSDPNEDPAEDLLSKRAQFVVSNSDLIYLILKHKPILIVANYFKRPAFALLTQGDIRSPLDLNGKTIGARTSSSNVRPSRQ